MSEGRLLDTALPFPAMYRVEEHPDAFKIMIEGRGKVPQLLRLWVNFQTCHALARKFHDGSVFMEKGPSGIYMLEFPVWKMHQGFEPKLTDTNVSSLVAPGGASVDSILADEAKKEKEEEPENA